MDRGPLVAVELRPGQYVKMYRDDAIARGLLKEDDGRKPEERIKNRESRIEKPEAEAEQSPPPSLPPAEDGQGEEEEVTVSKRPKRRPQGRNKMRVAEEDKGKTTDD